MFLISQRPLEHLQLAAGLENPTAGALITFSGVVRNQNMGKSVSFLEYEAYIDLAEKEGIKLLEEAKEKFDILDASGAHRIGSLQIGDTAVWIGVSSMHRSDGFRACQFIMDEIKKRLPIWKKEHYKQGKSTWIKTREVVGTN